ncbi:SdrD B-like protein [Tumebacillus sp. BK434]|nr:SdrD B-like protein [Tumebacillus sp. BK434]
MAGNYTQTFLPAPALYEGLTRAAQGGDTALDENPDPLTGKTGLIALAAGEKNHTIDAGVILKKGALGNYVWLDENGNGVQEDGDTGRNGIRVELYDHNGVLLKHTTTATYNGKDGYYLFDKLNSGDYRVITALPSVAVRFYRQTAGRRQFAVASQAFCLWNSTKASFASIAKEAFVCVSRDS